MIWLTLKRRAALFAAVLTAAANVCAAAQPAPATALPDALDLVPADAPLVVALRSIDEADAAGVELLQAAQLTTLSTFKQALTVIGVHGALDTTRGAAFALLPYASGDGEAASVRALLLLPVTSHGSFVAAMRATETGATTPMGEAVWSFSFNNVGVSTAAAGDGYSAVSLDHRTIEAVALARGQNAGRARDMQRVLASVSDAPVLILARPAQLVAMVESDAAGPTDHAVSSLSRLLEQFGTTPADAPTNTGLASAIPDWAGRALEEAAAASGDLLSQTRTAAVAVEPGPRGVRMRAVLEPRLASRLGAATFGFAAAAVADEPPGAASQQTTGRVAERSLNDDPLAVLPRVGWLGVLAVNSPSEGVSRLVLGVLGGADLLEALGPVRDAAAVVYASGGAAKSEAGSAASVALRPVLRSRLFDADTTPGITGLAERLARSETAGEAQSKGSSEDASGEASLRVEPFDTEPPGVASRVSMSRPAYQRVAARLGALAPLMNAMAPGGGDPSLVVAAGPGSLAVTPSAELAGEILDSAQTARDAVTARRSGIAAERMVRAVRRVLADEPLVEAHLNMQELLTIARPWLESRGLRMLRPARYPPLSASLSVEQGLVIVHGFVPAATVQNAFEMRKLIDASAVLGAFEQRADEDAP